MTGRTRCRQINVGKCWLWVQVSVVQIGLSFLAYRFVVFFIVLAIKCGYMPRVYKGINMIFAIVLLPFVIVGDVPSADARARWGRRSCRCPTCGRRCGRRSRRRNGDGYIGEKERCSRLNSNVTLWEMLAAARSKGSQAEQSDLSNHRYFFVVSRSSFHNNCDAFRGLPRP